MSSLNQAPQSAATVFASRRQLLLAELKRRSPEQDLEFVFSAGWSRPRNFAHNVYPFRAESHFLYLLGRHLEGAILHFGNGAWTLFTVEPEEEAALWHGPSHTCEQWEEELGLRVRPLGECSLGQSSRDVATLPPQDEESASWVSEFLGREVEAQGGEALCGPDALLADAMVALRLRHDEAGLAQLRFATQETALAHRLGMAASSKAQREAQVRGAMEGSLTASGLFPAYTSIVTTHGEILHASESRGALQADDLILCDVGGETEEGYAADITRTWPASGRFSSSQRDIYSLVLAVQKSAIADARPGREYAELHLRALREMAAGLTDLGILKGATDSLVESGAAALFFPHGLGHLLGLDVHDMEDLGHRAGHDEGRAVSSNPALASLRLNRVLRTNMVVTIEPGFYQIPLLLEKAREDASLRDAVNWERLESFADVRGIRIEDDVLIQDDEPEVLSSAAPKEIEAIEAACLAP